MPYMEENRKQAVTFLLQTYGGARRGGEELGLLAFPHHPPPQW